jgi:hypothetical protein
MTLAVKDKEEAKNKKGGKFKRVKRDDKKPVGEKSPETFLKKRRGDDDVMDLDEQGGGKKLKQGGSVAKELVSDSSMAGLLEQPCESQ